MRACAAAITSQAALESLSLQNVGCSIHACRAVEELLQASQALRQLHLFNNMSADEGAESIARILARAPAMEDFRMASSRVGFPPRWLPSYDACFDPQQAMSYDAPA